MSANVRRTLFPSRDTAHIRIYPVQYFETRRERIVFDNLKVGFICNGQLSWQPCPPQRTESGPWTPLARLSRT